MTQTATLPVATDSEDDGHDCLDFINHETWHCTECGESIDPADAECTWCTGYPCHCDDAYEAQRDRMLGD